MRQLRPGQKLSPAELPESHTHLQAGRYQGETEDGVSFELVINTTTRAMSGNEMAKATIDGMRRGRPGPSTLRVPQTEIYLLIGRQGRRNIRDSNNGYYSNGNIGSRSLREVVEKMIAYYGSKPASPTP
jgi:hypothetical protein